MGIRRGIGICGSAQGIGRAFHGTETGRRPLPDLPRRQIVAFGLHTGRDSRTKIGRNGQPEALLRAGAVAASDKSQGAAGLAGDPAVGVGETAPAAFLMIAILLCAIVAVTVFVGYAFLFSTQTASRFYLSIRRPIDGLLGALFGAAAFKILTYRPNW